MSSVIKRKSFVNVYFILGVLCCFSWKDLIEIMFKILFKMHGVLSFSVCLLKMQKLILNDTENVSNKNIYFRTSFLRRNQNFSWNSYFPTINLVLLNLYYLLANTFAADIFLLVLVSEVQKQIIKQKLYS